MKQPAGKLQQAILRALIHPATTGEVHGAAVRAGFRDKSGGPLLYAEINGLLHRLETLGWVRRVDLGGRDVLWARPITQAAK